jgi:murein DD-endopeptidase
LVFLWVTLEAGRAVPDSLTHRVTASAEGAAPFVTTTAPVVLAAPRHVPLGAPVHGGPWVAVRGPSPASGHRLSLVALDGVVGVPQRFAVDWVRLGDDGRLFRGEGHTVADWFSYNAPVVAVADGTVVLVRDGMADTTPRTPPPATVSITDAPGNVVVLDLGDGRFATYAHLQAGSIAVQQGARVKAGQQLARVGNSGNSLGPHLHFHVSGSIEPLGGEGLPFVMDQFDLVGRVPALGPMLAGTPWTAQASQPAREVLGETPMENMVVRFGER